MARLILEVLDARGAVRARHRLDAFPAVVGRGYASDVILDDPYVDARHLVLVRDEAGNLAAVDEGSVNGTSVRAADAFEPLRAAEAVPLHAGAVLRVGHTLLRVCDPDQPVPPALVDRSAPAGRGAHVAHDASAARWAARAGRGSLLARLTTGRAAAVLVLLATAVFAAANFFGSYEKTTGAKVVTEALGMVAALIVWAGVWALASRVVTHAFNFVAHLAIAAAAATTFAVLNTAGEWFDFLVPDAGLSGLFSGVGVVVVAMAMIAAHLAYASALPPRRRWATAGGIVGAVLAFAALSAYASRDDFTTRMEYEGQLKPLAPRWVHTVTLDRFTKDAADLRKEVDEMAKE